MPTSSSAFNLDKKRILRCKKKSLTPNTSTTQSTNKLTRSHSTLSASSLKKHNEESTLLLKTHTDGTIHISRSRAEKETHPDRLSLDRRALTMLPELDRNESNLRLLSFQHNLITSLDNLIKLHLPFLVFLDVYDNQIEHITSLASLPNLRVLLFGKNRLQKIEGLHNLKHLEVLDLHGNQITQVEGLHSSHTLKVLNLAGNQIKTIGVNDLKGLHALQELNLRRNRLKKLLGFEHARSLQKLFVSNNDINKVEDIHSLSALKNIRELSIEGNPVFQSGECVSFLIAFIPSILLLNGLSVNDQARKSAMAWRRNKEGASDAFRDLSQNVSFNCRRAEVISNARTNWELLRTQQIAAYSCRQLEKHANIQPDNDFITTKLVKKKKKIIPRKGSLLPDKTRFHLGRTNSMETDSSSNQSELFRLPPILLPIINKMDAASTSSIGPNFDSSMSSSVISSSENVQQASPELSSDDDLPDFPPEQQKHDEDPKITETSQKHEGISETGSNLSSSDTSCSSKKVMRMRRTVRSAIATTAKTLRSCNRPITAKPQTSVLKEEKPATLWAREREQGGDYLIEICGRYLNVYGHGALRFIEKSWCPTKANDVDTIHFNYANFNAISNVLNKVKTRFPNAEHFVFKETNIFCMGQLNALAETQGMCSLIIDIEGNAVTRKPEWRLYTVYRLSHWGLKCINDIQITEEEIANANETYASLSELVLAALPNETLLPLLQRMQISIEEDHSHCKTWLLQDADPALRSVVSKEALQWRRGSNAYSYEELLLRQRAKEHMTQLVHEMCDTMRKLKLFHSKWPPLLHEIVSNTLIDYSQMEIYAKRKLAELMKTCHS